MKKPKKPKAFIILVKWHGNGSEHDSIEVYSGLKCFIDRHKGQGFNPHTITGWITRRKLPYIIERCTIAKLPLIKPK